MSLWLLGWLCFAAPPPKPLAVVNVSFHQYDGGPALAAAHTFVPGETVFLVFQVDGFRASESEQVKLSYAVSPEDGGGTALVPVQVGKVEAELAPEDKDWLPKIRHEISLPLFLSSGIYRATITVKDEIAGKEAAAQAQFQVKGRRVEQSSTLTARNFRFLRSEEDGEPLAVPTYRPADTVWARFEITGFKIGEKNRFQVEYGLEVLSPSGKSLFSQPQAAVEQKEPFYPQRWSPGILSLTGRPDTRPGQYTIVLTLRDVLGNQTAESRHTFQVE